jgi:Type III secretion system YscX (type_III_YscX)
MKIKSLDVGVESVSRLKVDDIPRLPDQRGLRPVFLPAPQLLEQVLHRPSLDERLPYLLQPEVLDPELLEPATLSSVRREVRSIIAARARGEGGDRKRRLQLAASFLDNEVNLDEDVRRSLAALLRG